MRTLNPMLNRLAELPAFVAAVALFALMVMTFVDVLSRSILNAPVEAASELTRILMAIIVFTVLPVVSAKGDHIAVDLTDPLFSAPAARLRDGVLSLLCGGMLYWPTDRIIVLAERARSYGDVTEFLAIPQFYAGWMVGLFTGLTAIVLIARGLFILFVGGARRD